MKKVIFLFLFLAPISSFAQFKAFGEISTHWPTPPQTMGEPLMIDIAGFAYTNKEIVFDDDLGADADTTISINTPFTSSELVSASLVFNFSLWNFIDVSVAKAGAGGVVQFFGPKATSVEKGWFLSGAYYKVQDNESGYKSGGGLFSTKTREWNFSSEGEIYSLALGYDFGEKWTAYIMPSVSRSSGEFSERKVNSNLSSDISGSRSFDVEVEALKLGGSYVYDKNPKHKSQILIVAWAGYEKYNVLNEFDKTGVAGGLSVDFQFDYFHRLLFGKFPLPKPQAKPESPSPEADSKPQEEK